MQESIQYKEVKYYAVFEPEEDGRINVSFPDFPGCFTFGKNIDDARKNAREVLELWLEELASNKEEIPKQTGRPFVDEIAVRIAFA